MKYKDCTSLADMSAVNSNYLEQDIDDGCWFYQLPRLVNGDNMFYNDAMTELYEGRVPLWHFESNLQSLQSGINMFKGCSLDAASVKRIADTLSNTVSGTITLGIHYSLEGDSGVAASLAKIESKGWYVEVEYNLPYGYTELECLISNGTQYIDLNITVNDKTTLRGFVTADVTKSNYNLFGSQSPPYRLIYLNSSQLILLVLTGRYVLPAPASGEIRFEFSPGSCSVNGATVSTLLFSDSTKISLFRAYGSSEFLGSAKFYNFEAEADGVTVLSLIPVLNADREPGMWDKVSKRFFGNDGTGTFGYALKGQGERSTYSLRNPGVVQPSGVYARKSGENALEILADTEETTGAGWEWFANTGEAYEHFGVTQQSEEGEVIDA